MRFTPRELAHVYLYGKKDEYQDRPHWDDCNRLVTLVEARDAEWQAIIAAMANDEEAVLLAELATAREQKRATDNENLQLRAQLDPDGPAEALTEVMGMQTFMEQWATAAEKEAARETCAFPHCTLTRNEHVGCRAPGMCHAWVPALAVGK